MVTYHGEIETESGLQYVMIIRTMMEGMSEHGLDQQQSMGYAIAILKENKEIPEVKLGHCIYALRTQHEVWS
tara:strand:+ start:377 stop:592 length:216 start_codon:yes stop_codon:yes gene_type:complete